MNTGGGLFHAPLIRDGAVYAGGYGQVLFVSDLKTGKERLQLPAGGGVSGIPEVADGLIFYPCDDKSLHAVDVKTGQLKWQFKTSVDVPNPPEWISGPKADAKGRLYFGVADGTLVSVDAKTGKKLWSIKLTQPGIIPQPLVVGDSIFYSSWDTKVGLVSADTGKITTTHEMADSIYGLPQFDEGRFYVRSYEGVVFALDQHTLAQVWRANVGAWNATNSGNGIDYYPVVHDGVVCCPGENSTMFAFDATSGKALWKVKAAAPVFPAAIGDGVAVFGTEGGTLLAVDAKSGKRQWTYRAVGSLAEPVAEANGIVVASDTSGILYAVPVR
jgi:outer membrane protein assembly factor BamB